MSSDYTLLALLIAPVVVLTFLRINAAYVFLALCLGDVLVTRVAQDPSSLIAFVSPHQNSLSTATIELIIMLAPVVVTCAIMLFSVRKKSKMIVNLLPAAGVSCLLLLLIVPLFTPGLRYSVESQPLWQQMSRLQSLIYALGAVVSLALLWSQRRAAKSLEKDKRHHM